VIVCDLTHAYHATSGGIRTYIDEKRRFLLERTEHTHVLIIPGAEDRIERAGRAITYRLASPYIPGAKPYRFFAHPGRLQDTLAAVRPDVLELDTYYMPMEARPAFRYRDGVRAAGGRPPVLSVPYHTDFAQAYVGTYLPRVVGQRLGRWFEHRAEDYVGGVLRRCDLAFAFSAQQRERLVEQGVPGAFQVPLGTDLQQFHPSNADPALRASIGVGPSDVLLFYAGRFDSEKHVETLVDALDALPAHPRVVLAMAGDGPLRPVLEARAARTPRLRLLPFQSDRALLARWMASADVYVTAGPHETYGLSVVEAMASGLPVVGVRAGGLVHHVVPGTGYLGPVRDAEAMAANVRRAVEHRVEMGAAARRHTEATYSWAACFEAVLAGYERARGAQPHAPADPDGPPAARADGRPLRVLFVTHSFAPPGRPLANVGGMQRVAMELHAALTRHPRVALDTLALRSSERWYEVRAVPFLGRVLARLPAHARRTRPDVVLFSSMVSGALPALLALRRRMPPGVRLAAIAHGKDVTHEAPMYRKRLPRIFAALDAVLPVSSATAQASIERGADPARVFVVPNGIDTHRFADLPGRAEARAHLDARLGLDAGALLLVSVGRQVKRKGTAWFIREALPHLPASVHYAVAGGGPEDDAIRAAVEEAGVADRVHLLGRVSEEDLATLLAGGDLFVMPNVPVPGDMEGFGVVMLEAAMAGLPIVAAELEGIRDVVREGTNGHLVPALDAPAFVAAIARYVDDRPALARLSASARTYVEATFAWPAVADRYVEVLEEIVAAPASPG
jgi:glycosyltransferase involved in cell wall biosynthesis